jgi:hypothetical protein
VNALHRKRAIGSLAGLLLVLAFALDCALGQTNTPSSNDGTQADPPFVLKMTTREVVVEVVARDRHNHPVNDLKQDELQVMESGKHSQKQPKRILAFHLIDPATAIERNDHSSAGFRLISGGGCAVSTTMHYDLVYPASSESGYHEILVTTTRPHVTLSFRRRYYVGETAVPAKPQQQGDVSSSLREAACYHSALPSSISLIAQFIPAPKKESLRYSLVIQGDSLAFIALTDETRRVQLDYGICTFDEDGAPMEYMHTSVERVLAQPEYERALVHGLPNLLDIQGAKQPTLTRFVVRDRATGNLGSLDVVRPLPPVDNGAKHKNTKPPSGSIRGFGSVVPRPGAFCGDVYELPETTLDLPDFWNMDPIGSLYVDWLAVPDQAVAVQHRLNGHVIMKTEGIPGVTSRSAWFGIDYHGEFWVSTPGEYDFKLTSDDGARLYIDDQLVINLDGVHSATDGDGHVTLSAGRHTIHVPYFQGPPVSLALVLQVKAPGEEQFRVFDLRDFRAPAGAE